MDGIHLTKIEMKIKEEIVRDGRFYLNGKYYIVKEDETDKEIDDLIKKSEQLRHLI